MSQDAPQDAARHSPDDARPPEDEAPAFSPDLPDDAYVAFDLVPVRSRTDGWTPRCQREFIEALAESACVAAAARAVGKTPQSAWRLRRRPDAQAFSAAWDAALECGFGRLVSVALDRAINGSVRERYYRGEVVGEERVHHDGLLLALIRSGASMLANGRARRALREDWDGGMARLEAGAQRADDLCPTRYEVWDDGLFPVTNCPPGPRFGGFQSGLPGAPGYWRQLDPEELAGHAIKTGRDPFEDEDDRWSFFGLNALRRWTDGRRKRAKGRG